MRAALAADPLRASKRTLALALALALALIIFITRLRLLSFVTAVVQTSSGLRWPPVLPRKETRTSTRAIAATGVSLSGLRPPARLRGLWLGAVFSFCSVSVSLDYCRSSNLIPGRVVVSTVSAPLIISSHPQRTRRPAPRSDGGRFTVGLALGLGLGLGC